MKIKLNEIGNASILLAHFLIEDEEVAKAVISSAEWANGKNETTVTVQFSGVEVPAEVLERCLHNFLKQIETQVRVEYSDVEAEVQRRFEERMKERAGPVIEKMESLLEVLQDISSIIKPYWKQD